MRHVVAAIGAGAMLCGCATDLKVTQLDPNKPRTGIGYTLPFTQFSNDISWQVTSCKTKQPDGRLVDEMKIVAKVDSTAGKADDGRHAYLIDPASIQTFASVASLKVGFQDNSNLIDTLNESVEDQSGQIIVNVATGAAKLALAGVGAAAAPEPGKAEQAKLPGPPVTLHCKPEINTAVNAIKTLADQLSGLTDQLTDATNDLNRLTKKVAAMGGAVDDDTKSKLGQAIDRLNTLTASQSDLTDQLADAVKPLRYKSKVLWPQDSEAFTSYDPKYPPSRPFEQGAVKLPLETVEKWAVSVPSNFALPEVYFALEQLGTFGRDIGKPASDPDPNATGLRYWMAAQGRLVACTDRPCVSSDSKHVLVILDGPVAQLGLINLLPVHTRAFGSTTFDAAFNGAGGLKSAGYEQKTAPGVSASSTFSSVAAQAAPLIAANQPAAKLARSSAKLEALKKQRDDLAGLADDPNVAAKTQTAALTTDTALVNAQIADLQAKAALAAAQAAATAGK